MYFWCEDVDFIVANLDVKSTATVKEKFLFNVGSCWEVTLHCYEFAELIGFTQYIDEFTSQKVRWILTTLQAINKVCKSIQWPHLWHELFSEMGLIWIFSNNSKRYFTKSIFAQKLVITSCCAVLYSQLNNASWSLITISWQLGHWVPLSLCKWISFKFSELFLQSSLIVLWIYKGCLVFY